jgi:hypothetical protein
MYIGCAKLAFRMVKFLMESSVFLVNPDQLCHIFDSRSHHPGLPFPSGLYRPDTHVPNRSTHDMDRAHVFGDCPITGWSGRKDVRTGKFVDGPRERWKPDLKVVRASIRFLYQTGRLSRSSDMRVG